MIQTQPDYDLQERVAFLRAQRAIPLPPTPPKGTGPDEKSEPAETMPETVVETPDTSTISPEVPLAQDALVQVTPPANDQSTATVGSTEVRPPAPELTRRWAMAYDLAGYHPLELASCTATWLDVKKRGKRPVNKGWTAEPRPIHPDTYRNGCNLGLRMGKQSNGATLVCLDVDSVDPNEVFKISKEGPWPNTWIQRTGSGKFHFVYRWPAGVPVPGNKVRLSGTLIDIRSTGGQIVVTPSVHVETGLPYEWLQGPVSLDAPAEPAEPAELPDSVARAIVALAAKSGEIEPHEPKSRVTDDTRWFGADVKLGELLSRSLPEHGERHSACLMIAGWLCRKGWPQDCAASFLDATLNATGWDVSADEVSNDITSTYDAIRHDRKCSGRTALRELLAARQGERIGGAEFDELENALDLTGDHGLRKDKNGRALNCKSNLSLILSEHPAWRGRLARNEFTQDIAKRNGIPCEPRARTDNMTLTDGDLIRTTNWLSAQYRIESNVNAIREQILVAAEPRGFHPVREYLESLTWDGTPRIDSLFSRGFGAVDDEYCQTVSRRFLIGCVARVMQPGCKLDTAPMLIGEQGIYKSSGIKSLLPDAAWFADSTLAKMGDKDSMMNLRGKWIYELAELASMKRADVTAIKNYMSSDTDRFRVPYGIRPEDFPRQVALIGTTNEDTPLFDDSGNRRFWPLVCVGADLAWIRENRDQLWAEASAAYRAGGQGGQWWVDGELSALFAERAAEHEARDPWIETIEAGLARLSRGTFPGPAFDLWEGLTTRYVLEHVLGKEPAHQTAGDAIRVGKALTKLGWRKPSTCDGKRRVDGQMTRVWLPPKGTPGEPVWP